MFEPGYLEVHGTSTWLRVEGLVRFERRVHEGSWDLVVQGSGFSKV